MGFLLYSCVPILLGYYVLQKRKVQDRIYLLLMNTYVLANAFWIIVINASFPIALLISLGFISYSIVLSFITDVYLEKSGKENCLYTYSS